MEDEVCWTYKPIACHQEKHGQSLFCVAFNHRDASLDRHFATVGGNRATIYRIEQDGKVSVLCRFVDNNEGEEFYVCAWSQRRDTGAPLLLVAGKHGMIHVLDCQLGALHMTLMGHGAPVNDIAVHPSRPELVATASKDHTVRLWNLVNARPVLICHGDGGHLNEVLSLDWKLVGSRYSLLSAGMDSCIKIWDLTKFESKMDECIAWSDPDHEFPVVRVAYPVFSAQVHGNYVDCARWVGDLVVSKSVDDKMLLWLPELEGFEPRALQEGRYTIVQEMHLEECANVWWLRFGLDASCSRLALGNRRGAVLLYDLAQPPSRTSGRAVPPRARASAAGEGAQVPRALVRQAALSSCGAWLASAHDRGLLVVYRAQEQASKA